MANNLDHTDVLILKTLQNSGRKSNADLAKIVGISPPPCLRRVKKLENKGYIISYHASLNQHMLGFSVTVFATVALENHSDNLLKKFEDQINLIPMVRECYMITGGADFLLKIVAKDFESYQKFLSDNLFTLGNIMHIKTKMVVKNSKNDTGIPFF
jgi:DNA-binding Lrp family transcriptional regulator